MRPWRRSAVAIDLGSARTRAWSPDQGLLFDVPTLDTSHPGPRHPVQRGAVVDVSGAARLLEKLLGGPHAPRVIALTTPVSSEDAERAAAIAVLDGLKPRAVLPIESVRAAALGAHVDLGAPLLVIDLGAGLTELALFTGGEIVHAVRLCLGTSDLGTSTTAVQLVAAIVDSTVQALQQECAPQLVAALDRGPLLAGGGAGRPEITYTLARKLGTTVHPAAAPQTAAVRGAAIALQAAQRHPGLL